jgi:hypothetical protein
MLRGMRTTFLPAFLLLGPLACAESRPSSPRPAQPTPPQPAAYQPQGGFAPQAPPGPGYCESKQQRARTCAGESAACSQHEAQCLPGILRNDFFASFLDCVRQYPCGTANIDDVCMGVTLRRMPLVTPMQNHVQQACLTRGPACPNKLAANCRVLPRANEQVLRDVNACFAYPGCDGVEQCVEHILDRFGCP